MFSSLSKANLNFQFTIILSSGNALNLDQSIILSFGKHLSLAAWHFLDMLFHQHLVDFEICFAYFYAPVSKDPGHIVSPLSVRPSVRTSVHPSVCLH